MKILNFGSLNIDNTFRVDHFVKPGETIRSAEMTAQSGGKGLNQSIALARAGAEVYHAGKIGRDGDLLRQTLVEAGVHDAYVGISERFTGRAVIQVDSSGQNCILLYGGANEDIDDAFIRKVLADFSAGDLLLLQNEISGLPSLLEYAGRVRLRVALNPSPVSRELTQIPLDCVEWFFLNEIEAEALTGENVPERAAGELLRRYPKSHIVLTLGEQGVFYSDSRLRMRHPACAVDCVDSTGAGDTFTGYFVAGICAGTAPAENLRRATTAAALSVTRPGAADSIPTLKEVLGARLTLRD